MSDAISMLSEDKMSSLPKTTYLSNQKQFRIIPSTYPPINFFEDLVNPDEMETLWEIESLTNERLQHEVGELFLVPKIDRISGPGSSVIMAAFTHLSPDRATRFTDGQFGVYYAAFSKETAIRETVYHRERFMRSTNELACEITMRVYEGKIIKPLHDIRGNQYKKLHHPDSYIDSQLFGHKLKKLNSWGLIYNSVRHAGGHCIAAFRPPAVSIPSPHSHIKYIWNGEKISDVLEMNHIFSF
jgi:hypothetical protein